LSKANLRKTVAICIPTFQRREGLRRLLSALARQVSIEHCDVTIIVIDNECSPETKAICDNFVPLMAFPVVYCREPLRGISRVRNKGVETARQYAEFLVFIDDDEVPSPEWLSQLIECQDKYSADVVAGPVEPHFTCSVPRWIQEGGFFDRERYATGTILTETRTGNVLIKMDVFDRIGLFDDRFALIGGEDTDFFMRVHQAGGRMIWADNAVVEEWIPASRVRARWLLMRSFRIGSSEAMRTRGHIASVLIRGMLRCVKNVCVLPVSALRGRPASLRSLQKLFHAAGMISGVFGHPYEEYREIHPV
jgi:succinoglycan biosynthesis protein ExoM